MTLGQTQQCGIVSTIGLCLVASFSYDVPRLRLPILVFRFEFGWLSVCCCSKLFATLIFVQSLWRLLSIWHLSSTHSPRYVVYSRLWFSTEIFVFNDLLVVVVAGQSLDGRPPSGKLPRLPKCHTVAVGVLVTNFKRILSVVILINCYLKEDQQP